MKYKNHIDNFYFVIYGLLFSTALVIEVVNFVARVNWLYIILSFLTLLLMIYYINLFINRTYEIKKNKLIVKTGFLKYTYNLKEIKKSFIVEGNNPSFATARKRICIIFKDDRKIFISPLKREEVLMKLINGGA